MPFFEYTQNNSGGRFLVDNFVCHRLFIEAPTLNVANGKAFDLGVYFGGCNDGRDCPCCGDRWNPYCPVKKLPVTYESMSAEEAKHIVSKYGAKSKKNKSGDAYDITFPTIESYAQYLADYYGWTSPDCRIYYEDGRVVEIFSNKKNEKIQDNATPDKGRRRKRNKANARRS